MKIIYLLTVLAIISFSSLSFAQETNEKADSSLNEEKSSKADEKEEKDKELTDKEKAIKERSKVKFRVLPGPTYDPAIGFGLTVIPMAIYYPDKTDLISPPSQTAIYYMISSNKSTGGGISQKFYLSEDHWRIDMGALVNV